MNASLIKNGKKEAVSTSANSDENQENKTAPSKMSSFRPGGLNIINPRRGNSSSDILGGTRKSLFSSGLKIGGKKFIYH